MKPPVVTEDHCSTDGHNQRYLPRQMNESKLTEILLQLREGKRDIPEVLELLKHWPSSGEMNFACLDHHRPLRTGLPEVVYGENKTAEQITAILKKMLQHSGAVMATRVDSEKAAVACQEIEGLVYYQTARMLIARETPPGTLKVGGPVLVLSAGTSDMPVAEEALLTARSMGNPVEKLYDVGVAGIHRLLTQRELLARAAVIIVVAGMEGALPSVVGGLVDKPVIAVPTSVGYGTGFGGLAALLSMLNSCTPGVAVVNIDNGFGAGCLATTINRR